MSHTAFFGTIAVLIAFMFVCHLTVVVRGWMKEKRDKRIKLGMDTMIRIMTGAEDAQHRGTERVVLEKIDHPSSHIASHAIRPRDKYDDALDYLLAIKDDEKFMVAVERAWHDPYDKKDCGGCLFAIAVADPQAFNQATHLGEHYRGKNTFDFGCLTMIRNHLNDRHCAETPELTERIRNDERIPTYWKGVTRENLPVFAEYRRLIEGSVV